MLNTTYIATALLCAFIISSLCLFIPLRNSKNRITRLQHIVEALLENTPGQCLIRDSNDRYLSANRSWQESAGFQPSGLRRDDQVIGSNYIQYENPAGEHNHFQKFPEHAVMEVLVKFPNRAAFLADYSRTIEPESGVIIELWRDLTRDRKNEELVARMNQHDQLTNLPVRKAFLDRVDHDLRKAYDGEPATYALYIISVDQHKDINSTYGYDNGDHALRQIAKRLKEFSDNNGYAGRLIGNRFGLLRKVDKPSDAQAFGEILVASIGLKTRVGEDSISLRCSAGVALYPAQGHSAEELCRAADECLSAHPTTVRKGIVVFAGRDATATASVSQKKRITYGLEHGEFEIEFEPLVEIETGATFAVESLVRWNDKRNNLYLKPASFFQMVNEHGMFNQLGQYCIEKTFEKYIARADKNPCLNINLFDRQLENPLFPDWLHDTLHEFGIRGSNLMIDVNVSAIDGITPNIEGTLNRLAQIGVELYVDDFGKLMTSLEVLSRLPITGLKLDPSTTRNISIDDDQKDNVKMFVGIARNSLNNQKRIIAEGVSSPTDRVALAQLGINYYQGSLAREYSEPKGKVTSLFPQA